MQDNEQIMMPISLDAQNIEEEFKQKHVVGQQDGKHRLLKASSSAIEGEITGIALLIDFPVFDEDGNQTTTVMQRDFPNITLSGLNEMLNGDAWDPANNVYSLKSYYKNQSNGKFIEKNLIVGPVVVPHERSYYDDSSKGMVDCAGPLLVDAFATLKADPDYETKYRKIFCQATRASSTGSSQVKALTVMFIGKQASTWCKGLWPFSSTLNLMFGNCGSYSPDRFFLDDDGVQHYFQRFFITNVSNYTSSKNACIHENGHIACGFPDMYASSSSNGNGLGYHCMMAYGTNLNIPVSIDPYLREKAGWIQTIDITDSVSGSIASMPDNGETVYKYRNKNNRYEYFLISHVEKRLGEYGEGILIWHVDETGSNYSGSGWYDLGNGQKIRKYMVQLVEPDGKCAILNGTSFGGGNMWSVQADANEFNDMTTPCAKWKDGSDSGLCLSRFFSSSSKNIGICQISSPDGSFSYTGKAICPDIEVEDLERDKDFVVTYQNNIEVGTATATVQGIGKYYGKKQIGFNII